MRRIILILILFLVGCSDKPKTHQQGEQVGVGWREYQIAGSRWADSFDNIKPNASFLIVDLSVKNIDKEPRPIPTFFLIDNAGAIYKRAYLYDTMPEKENLNPGVSRSGSIVFDVPQDRSYSVKLSGGSKDNYALVQLPAKAGAFSKDSVSGSPLQSGRQ